MPDPTPDTPSEAVCLLCRTEKVSGFRGGLVNRLRRHIPLPTISELSFGICHPCGDDFLRQPWVEPSASGRSGHGDVHNVRGGRNG